MQMHCLEIILPFLIGITGSRPKPSGYSTTATNSAGCQAARLDVIQFDQVVHSLYQAGLTQKTRLERGGTWNFVERLRRYHYLLQKSSYVILWHILKRGGSEAPNSEILLVCSAALANI